MIINGLVVLFMAMQLEVTFGQDCRRIFGRATAKIEEKSMLEIAQAAVDEMCEGTCSTDFVVPEICPLIAKFVEQYTTSGFALIPTFDMTLIVSQTEIHPPKSYILHIIFDYNSFSGDVFLSTYSYTQLEEEEASDVLNTAIQLQILDQIDLLEFENEIDLVEITDSLQFEPPNTE